MKCLVTGGAGFIGSHLVDTLILNGFQVDIIDNLSTGKIENLNPKAKFYENDIRFLEPKGEYDYIFHLASLARIQPSIDYPIPTHGVNLTGTLRVLELARKCGAKIIFSGSSSAYDDIELPSKEDSPIKAKNPYTLQKIASEMYIKLWSDLFGVKYCILRYFNVFGERQILEGEYAAVVGIFLNQKRENKVLTITGDGEQRRDFTYVKDVAKANLMAMNWNGVYNIGTGVNYSMNEIAQAVGGAVEYIPKRPGEVRKTLADISKARKAGWEPTLDILEWVANVS